jgi:ABC-2 type transport system ATP-binding protein
LSSFIGDKALLSPLSIFAIIFPEVRHYYSDLRNSKLVHDVGNIMKKSNEAITSIRNVGKYFDEKLVLSDINLDLFEGEVVSILGPNGAGKTTLINAMLGRLSLDSGEISILGCAPETIQVKRHTGAMLQVSGLPDMSTIKEHIQLFQSYYAHPMEYGEVMAFSGLKDIENQYSKTLSGGQKQRLLFALAICGNPKLLFLDEPTVGMDVDARKSLWKAIERMKSRGTSILLTTHYLEEADQLSDRIIMLNRGKIIREGTPDQIKSQINTKKIRFYSSANIAALSALKSVSQVDNLVEKNQSKSGANYYEVASFCAEKTVLDIFSKQIEVTDLIIIGAALEDAFDFINKQESAAVSQEGE